MHDSSETKYESTTQAAGVVQRAVLVHTVLDIDSLSKLDGDARFASRLTFDVAKNEQISHSIKFIQ